MEVTYLNKRLKKLCDQSQEAQKKLGANCARKLRSRLADLKAAESVTGLVAGNTSSSKRRSPWSICR